MAQVKVIKGNQFQGPPSHLHGLLGHPKRVVIRFFVLFFNKTCAKTKRKALISVCSVVCVSCTATLKSVKHVTIFIVYSATCLVMIV